MKLRTRFIIAIASVLTGFLAISGLTLFLIVGIDRLNQADTICHRTVMALKQLQLTTAQLLTTQELDKTFTSWKQAHRTFEEELEQLNACPYIRDFLADQDKEATITAMNTFWGFTRTRTARLERDLTAILSRPNPSRDGLIYQYADTRDHALLEMRNTIDSALLFLEADFEIKLNRLITIVEKEKSGHFRRLTGQITGIGLLIAVIVSTILVTFLTRLRTYLARLHHTMNIIGQGDFSRKLHIPGNDELSRIASAINATTDALSDMHEQLNQRVEELSLAKEKAEAANRAKSVFLANMSHEIRTPLNAVIGFSELLAAQVTDKKQKNWLTAIRTAGKSLLTLINDILDLSKIEADKIHIRVAPCNIRTIVFEVEQVFSIQASRKKLALAVDIDETLPEALLLDGVRLRQVLLNIVGNAVKFTREGRIILSVRRIPRPGSDRIDLRLSVADTGIGIPEGDIDRIFEAFEQRPGQDAGLYGGTGLGLAITRRLVEMMNGKIWVESRLDQGSLFHILIRDVRPSSEAVPPPPLPFSPHRIQFETCTVLVADDMESQRTLLTSLLSQLSLTPVTAENGREAVDRARSHKPALILMDIRMPEMDGTTATRRLKSDAATRHIPIIAVTASSTDADALRDRGFDDHLPKPIDFDALLTVLSRHLKVRSMPSPDACPRAGTLPPRILSRLPAVLRILENEITDLWESFRHQQPMDAVKAFGEQIQSLGRSHELDILTTYGDDLVFHVEAFDVAQMQAALDAFPALIQTLKTHSGETHDD